MIITEDMHDIKKSQVKLQPYQNIDIILPELFRTGAVDAIYGAIENPRIS